MQILIDIGNTRLKWLRAQAGMLSAVSALDYRDDNFLPILRRQWQSLPPPLRIGMACVGPGTVRDGVVALAKELWPAADCRIAGAQAAAYGVYNGYAQPEKLGVDRWLALVAAHRHYPGACLIVDCGTAITLDWLLAGRHQGGMICPGLRLMKKSLAAETVALTYQTGVTAAGLADHTAAAIDAGVLNAAVGLIANVYHGLTQPSRLLLTGGDAGLLSAHLPLPHTVDASLVFKGLDIALSAAQPGVSSA